MLHIMTDSSAMLDNNDFAAFHVARLTIEIDGKSLQDGLQIGAAEVLEACRQGKLPKSSQPSIGEKIDCYDAILKDRENTILDLTIADGISGTYQSALLARQSSLDPQRVVVFNTQTLAGPQRDLVLEAIERRDRGEKAEEIVAALEKRQGSDLSMVAAPDMKYLARSGRVSSLGAAAGTIMKLVPVAELCENGSALSMLKTVRTLSKAIGIMVNNLFRKGADASWTFYIAHAGNEKAARQAAEKIAEVFGPAKIVIDPLCALFTVHGGPGALSIQAIRPSEKETADSLKALPAVINALPAKSAPSMSNAAL